jgi:hypothetical protein
MLVERRTSPRHASAERAAVEVGAGNRIACIVTDIGPRGARLGFAAPVALPRRFELVLAATGQRSEVRLVWQRDLVAGVSFDARPKLADRVRGGIRRTRDRTAAAVAAIANAARRVVRQEG